MGRLLNGPNLARALKDDEHRRTHPTLHELYDKACGRRRFAKINFGIFANSSTGFIVKFLTRHRIVPVLMSSVKPFKSKNRDKIYLDASNPNLKKTCDRDFRATALPMNLNYELLCGFIE